MPLQATAALLLLLRRRALRGQGAGWWKKGRAGGGAEGAGAAAAAAGRFRAFCVCSRRPRRFQRFGAGVSKGFWRSQVLSSLQLWFRKPKLRRQSGTLHDW